MRRHFTVTGFVSFEGRTALHWHRLGMWLPPGGHIEADEDPVQAVHREVREETGLAVAIVGRVPAYAYADPPQLATPAAMAVYDIPRDGSLDEPHQHIDLIYFTTPTDGPSADLPSDGGSWLWVDADTLRRDDVLTHAGDGRAAPVARDVRELGIAAIEAAGA